MSLVLDHETYSSIFSLKKMHLLWKQLSGSIPIKMHKDGSNSYGGATESWIIHRTCGPGPRWGHHQVILPSETSIHCSVQNPTCHPFFDWLIHSEWDCFNGYESGSWTTPPMVWSTHGRASHLYVICCMLSLYSCIFLTDQSNKYYPKLVYVLPIACFTHGLPLIECLYTTYLLPKIIYSSVPIHIPM
jgi:hypothetical protein